MILPTLHFLDEERNSIGNKNLRADFTSAEVSLSTFYVTTYLPFFAIAEIACNNAFPTT